MTTSIRTTHIALSSTELAQAIERLVKHELEVGYELFLTDSDSFDLTDDGALLLVNNAGDTALLPSSARHVGLVAAAIELRNREGC